MGKVVGMSKLRTDLVDLEALADRYADWSRRFGSNPKCARIAAELRAGEPVRLPGWVTHRLERWVVVEPDGRVLAGE